MRKSQHTFRPEEEISVFREPTIRFGKLLFFHMAFESQDTFYVNYNLAKKLGADSGSIYKLIVKICVNVGLIKE